MKDKKWTKTPPSEPGWYWIRFLSNSWFGEIRIVHVEKSNNMFIVWEVSEQNHTSIRYYNNAYWLGPLEVPQPPEEK